MKNNNAELKRFMKGIGNAMKLMHKKSNGTLQLNLNPVSHAQGFHGVKGKRFGQMGEYITMGNGFGLPKLGGQ